MENEATAAVATAAGDNPYGLEALVTHGDAVSYTVLGILLIMSLISWYIIFTKLWDQHRLGKSVKAVEKNFWSAGTAREGADRLPKDDDFRVIAESAIRAAGHHEGRLGDRISWAAACRSWQRSVPPPRSSACSARCTASSRR
jgi:biopolymer transport protein ExbB